MICRKLDSTITLVGILINPWQEGELQGGGISILHSLLNNIIELQQTSNVT